MPRPFTPKIVTANDLLQGDVIYLTKQDAWSRSHADAELLTDEAHAQLRLIEAQTQPHVVGPYLADAVDGPSGPKPVHFREEVRVSGPTNYDHAEGDEPHV